MLMIFSLSVHLIRYFVNQHRNLYKSNSSFTKFRIYAKTTAFHEIRINAKSTFVHTLIAM